MTDVSRRSVLAAGMVAAAPAWAQVSPALQAMLDYVQSQKTTGFMIVRDGRPVVARNWPLGVGSAAFRAGFVHGQAADGSLLEDVASQQKSFVAVLCAMAQERGLLDPRRPVSDYVGAGWSRAAGEAERAIHVDHLLTMSSGLGEDFAPRAAPGSTFFYNTPVYAVLKRVLASAARAPLETITQDWLTRPAGMSDTAWRQRPAALADVGNPTGLVTTPRDVARFGQLVLDRGHTADGQRIVSDRSLAALFERSATNPAYGRLWWLNGSDVTIRPLAKRTEGPLIPAAPRDLVAALGAMDRKLYVVPSRRLVVVRMGPAAPDADFDQQLWSKLTPALA